MDDYLSYEQALLKIDALEAESIRILGIDKITQVNQGRTVYTSDIYAPGYEDTTLQRREYAEARKFLHDKHKEDADGLFEIVC